MTSWCVIIKLLSNSYTIKVKAINHFGLVSDYEYFYLNTFVCLYYYLSRIIIFTKKVQILVYV